MPAWLSLLGALGLGALLASAVNAVVLWLNGRAQRGHESDLRAADRAHEVALRQLDQAHHERMQSISDRRVVRDHRSERIYRNLLSVVDIVTMLKDEVDKLRYFPQKHEESRKHLGKVVDHIIKQRPALLLDTDTSALYDRLGDAIQKWNVFWEAIISKDKAKAAGENPAEFTKTFAETGPELTLLLSEIIAEARTALARAEAPIE
jgi:hypothetical protein